MTGVERPLGRLIMVTGADPQDVAGLGYAVAARLTRAIHVDGPVLDRMLVTDRAPAEQPLDPAAVEQLYLRLLAAIAVAETYQQAGFDAVISDVVVDGFLEDFLDFVSPAQLHLVVLGGPAGAPPQEVGLWLDPAGRSVVETANDVLDRLDEALVTTR